MAYRKGTADEDRLIKEALRRELEEIQPPPGERVWRRIEARLAGLEAPERSLRRRRRRAWLRYSALAAALLLCLLGAREIYRSFSPGFGFLADAEAGPDTRGEGDLVMENALHPSSAAEDDGWALPSDGWVAADPVQGEETLPSAPPAVNGFRLAGVSSAEIAPGYKLRAARYVKKGVTLFWITSEPPLSDLASFLAALRDTLPEPLNVTGETDGRIHLQVDGTPGLAWRAVDGSLQALWEPTGTLTAALLAELLPALADSSYIEE